MKLRQVLPGLFALLIAASCHATTLKLTPDITLLVLDGRSISGSLLKGAEGLELGNGEHQFLFRVEKHAPNHHSDSRTMISEPLIATLSAQTKSISIRLPPLQTARDLAKLNRTAIFQLVDESGNEITSRRDSLGKNHSANLEQAMMAYNTTNGIAAVPRFAHSSSPTASVPLLTNQLANNGDTERKNRLKRWMSQIDSAAGQRWLSLLDRLHVS